MTKGEINYVAYSKEQLSLKLAFFCEGNLIFFIWIWNLSTAVELAAMFKLGGKGFYVVNIAKYFWIVTVVWHMDVKG
jgi:hypothetical protein